jgi:hypothetical protein
VQQAPGEFLVGAHRAGAIAARDEDLHQAP